MRGSKESRIEDRNLLAPTKNEYPSTAFACAASCRFNRFNVDRLTFPACTAASPYLLRSSRGEELWSSPRRTLAPRVLNKPYARTKLAIR